MTYYDYNISEEYQHQFYSTTLNILDLNDDCLIHILNYLSDHQLVGIFGTCRRLDEIIQITLRRCKKLCFSMRNFNSDDRKLIRMVEPYLTSIKFSVGYSVSDEIVLSILELISNSSKLRNLTLHYVTMCDQFLHIIASISDQLERIDFSFCQLRDEVTMDFFKCHCSSLRELIVIGNYSFVGSPLVYLRNLKQLIVESHENFDLNLNEIRKNNPKAEIIIYEKGRSKSVALIA